MIKDLAFVAVAAAVIVMAVVQFVKDPVTVQVEEGVGTIVGPDVFDHMYFNASFGQGGVFTIATTAAAFTVTDRDLRDASVISISNVGTAAKTLTLPASSSWASLVPNGMSQEWVIDNLHTVAGTTTTITAGAGVDIDGITANDDIVNGDASALMKCWRLPNANIRCIVQEMLDAG